MAKPKVTHKKEGKTHHVHVHGVKHGEKVQMHAHGNPVACPVGGKAPGKAKARKK